MSLYFILLIRVYSAPRFRDISVSFGGINLLRKKRLEFDIKWDVNRDPGQKLNFAINFENPVAKNYSMNALLSYPGRTVKCAFNGAVNGKCNV